jgi:hypothetical protein
VELVSDPRVIEQPPKASVTKTIAADMRRLWRLSPQGAPAIATVIV